MIEYVIMFLFFETCSSSNGIPTLKLTKTGVEMSQIRMSKASKQVSKKLDS
jgi:hypothetical protein